MKTNWNVSSSTSKIEKIFKRQPLNEPHKFEQELGKLWEKAKENDHIKKTFLKQLFHFLKLFRIKYKLWYGNSELEKKKQLDLNKWDQYCLQNQLVPKSLLFYTCRLLIKFKEEITKIHILMNETSNNEIDQNYQELYSYLSLEISQILIRSRHQQKFLIELGFVDLLEVICETIKNILESIIQHLNTFQFNDQNGNEKQKQNEKEFNNHNADENGNVKENENGNNNENGNEKENEKENDQKQIENENKNELKNEKEKKNENDNEDLKEKQRCELNSFHSDIFFLIQNSLFQITQVVYNFLIQNEKEPKVCLKFVSIIELFSELSLILSNFKKRFSFTKQMYGIYNNLLKIFQSCFKNSDRLPKKFIQNCLKNTLLLMKKPKEKTTTINFNYGDKMLKFIKQIQFSNSQVKDTTNVLQDQFSNQNEFLTLMIILDSIEALISKNFQFEIQILNSINLKKFSKLISWTFFNLHSKIKTKDKKKNGQMQELANGIEFENIKGNNLSTEKEKEKEKEEEKKKQKRNENDLETVKKEEKRKPKQNTNENDQEKEQEQEKGMETEKENEFTFNLLNIKTRTEENNNLKKYKQDQKNQELGNKKPKISPNSNSNQEHTKVNIENQTENFNGKKDENKTNKKEKTNIRNQENKEKRNFKTSNENQKEVRIKNENKLKKNKNQNNIKENQNTRIEELNIVNEETFLLEELKNYVSSTKKKKKKLIKMKIFLIF